MAAGGVSLCFFFFFFQAEDGIRDVAVTGVQTCALPICVAEPYRARESATRRARRGPRQRRRELRRCPRVLPEAARADRPEGPVPLGRQIGRASCRERV